VCFPSSFPDRPPLHGHRALPPAPPFGRARGRLPANLWSPGTLTHEFGVTVKYVRREIRDLTDRDRETFFNAVSVLQRVPSAVGR
ncbi:unnamed protein product, partial [Ectocarpus sp. 12 AP-2014]